MKKLTHQDYNNIKKNIELYKNSDVELNQILEELRQYEFIYSGYFFECIEAIFNISNLEIKNNFLRLFKERLSTMNINESLTICINQINKLSNENNFVKNDLLLILKEKFSKNYVIDATMSTKVIIYLKNSINGIKNEIIRDDFLSIFKEKIYNECFFSIVDPHTHENILINDSNAFLTFCEEKMCFMNFNRFDDDTIQKFINLSKFEFITINFDTLVLRKIIDRVNLINNDKIKNQLLIFLKYNFLYMYRINKDYIFELLESILSIKDSSIKSDFLCIFEQKSGDMKYIVDVIKNEFFEILVKDIKQNDLKIIKKYFIFKECINFSNENNPILFFKKLIKSNCPKINSNLIDSIGNAIEQKTFNIELLDRMSIAELNKIRNTLYVLDNNFEILSEKFFYDYLKDKYIGTLKQLLQPYSSYYNKQKEKRHFFRNICIKNTNSNINLNKYFFNSLELKWSEATKNLTKGQILNEIINYYKHNQQNQQQDQQIDKQQQEQIQEENSVVHTEINNDQKQEDKKEELHVQSEIKEEEQEVENQEQKQQNQQIDEQQQEQNKVQKEIQDNVQSQSETKEIKQEEQTQEQEQKEETQQEQQQNEADQQENNVVQEEVQPQEQNNNQEQEEKIQQKEEQQNKSQQQDDSIIEDQQQNQINVELQEVKEINKIEDYQSLQTMLESIKVSSSNKELFNKIENNELKELIVRIDKYIIDRRELINLSEKVEELEKIDNSLKEEMTSLFDKYLDNENGKKICDSIQNYFIDKKLNDLGILNNLFGKELATSFVEKINKKAEEYKELIK